MCLLQNGMHLLLKYLGEETRKKCYLLMSKFETFYRFLFPYDFILIYSICYTKRNYWNREKFRLPFFDGFTCFRMSETAFQYLYKAFFCHSLWDENFIAALS